jgi:hypothetical protein
MLKQSVKLHRYVLCGGVAGGMVSVLCAVQGSGGVAACPGTAHSTLTIPGHNMLPHHCIIHDDIILPTVCT